MTALKNCSAELRNYLFSHKLPEVFEALLTGLAIECPKDACGFVIDKLTMLSEDKEVLESLRWDSFINEEKRPKGYFLKQGFVEFMWSYEDENSQPTPEMYQRAYSLYNFKLKVLCLRAWMKYHLHKKRKKLALIAQLNDARLYYLRRKARVYFDALYILNAKFTLSNGRQFCSSRESLLVGKGSFQWFLIQKKVKQDISNKIHRVVKLSLIRMVFKAWQSCVVDARKTREYFERIEKGEVIDVGEYGDFFHVSFDGNDVISSLPKHVAILIFNYVDLQELGRCASVSRSWKLIIQSNILWSKMDLSKLKDRVTNNVTARLVHRYRSVLGHLNLRGCSNLTKKCLKIISESRNLQDLNVSECVSIDDDVVKSISAGCPSLLYLNLSQCKISDATLRCLARNCVNLQYLSLAACPGFSDKGLSYLSHGKGARKMSYLDLSGCDQITSQGYLLLSLGFLNLNTIILNNLPSLRDDQLKSLTERCCSGKVVSILNSPFLSDSGIKCLALFRRLQKIQIEGNNRITDSSIKALAKNCPDLRHVYLVDCPRITDLSLKALSSCKNLVVLNIADCVRIQDAGVRQIVEGPSGSKLRELNLTNCVRVSDVTLLRIAQRCHNLTYCSICYCEHVTDAGVELLSTLPSLISLDVSGCNIQDQGVASFGNGSRLRDVTLSECHIMTDLGLQKMSQNCRQLENLDLCYCVNITDYAMKNLAFCCRLLRTLNLAGCKKLTDSSVQYLAGVCHYIQSLNMSGCFLLTCMFKNEPQPVVSAIETRMEVWENEKLNDRSIRFMRKGMKQLKYLNILYCRNITKGAVKKLQLKCPKVLHSNDEPPPSFNHFYKM